jgi:spermidine synthase
MRDPSFSIITAAGFGTTIAQILLLRELLVLFHGNEMSTGLALAGWLLWTSVGSALAARFSGRRPPRAHTLAVLLALLALAVPTLVLLVRGARQVFGIPAYPPCSVRLPEHFSGCAGRTGERLDRALTRARGR